MEKTVLGLLCDIAIDAQFMLCLEDKKIQYFELKYVVEDDSFENLKIMYDGEMIDIDAFAEKFNIKREDIFYKIRGNFKTYPFDFFEEGVENEFLLPDQLREDIKSGLVKIKVEK